MKLIKYLLLSNLLASSCYKIHHLTPERLYSVRNIKKLYYENNIYYDLYNDFCKADILCNEDECEINLEYTNYKSYRSLTAEHIFPQSYTKRYSIARYDMHNIFLTSNYINYHRSNYKFSEANISNDKNLIVIDDINYKNDMDKLFIPCVNSRGPISRAIAYMLTNYPRLMSSYVLDIDLLIKWNNLYPPSELELERNEVIKELQGNENLFIKDYKKLSI